MIYTKFKDGIIFNENCIGENGMCKITDKSVDMILCDLPYQKTQNIWDTIIPFEPLWEQYKRIIKDNGVITLFGQDKFVAKLMLSNESQHRYNIIWEKTKAGGFLNAQRMPLCAHEEIAIFYRKLPCYNPQYIDGKPYIKKAVTNGDGNNYGKFERAGITKINNGKRFPRSVIKFSNDNHNSIHPTQKPVTLFEYLVKTYTNEGDLVLDNCAGSGTTGIACLNLNRKFILYEWNDKDNKYYDIAVERIKKREEELLNEQR